MKLFGTVEKAASVQFKKLPPYLNAIKEARVKNNQLALPKAYDDLASVLPQNEYKSVVEYLSSDKIATLVWDYYLRDAADNQLVQPDDYSYARNYIQSPYWLALLLTKLNVKAPVSYCIH